MLHKSPRKIFKSTSAEKALDVTENKRIDLIVKKHQDARNARYGTHLEDQEQKYGYPNHRTYSYLH